MIKAMQQKIFTVFTDFLLTVKLFPTNFITIIWSTNINATSFFCSSQKQNFFPHYDKIQ